MEVSGCPPGAYSQIAKDQEASLALEVVNDQSLTGDGRSRSIYRYYRHISIAQPRTTSLPLTTCGQRPSCCTDAVLTVLYLSTYLPWALIRYLPLGSTKTQAGNDWALMYLRIGCKTAPPVHYAFIQGSSQNSHPPAPTVTTGKRPYVNQSVIRAPPPRAFFTAFTTADVSW